MGDLVQLARFVRHCWVVPNGRPRDNVVSGAASDDEDDDRRDLSCGVVSLVFHASRVAF